MPIIDAQDARELDSHLQRFFDSTPAEHPLRLRQLFTQKFDFNPATGKVSLAEAPQNVSLPSDADRIASIEGINVIYVPLQIPGTTRVRKAEAVAAARLIAGQLGDDMLLLMTNEQTEKVLQLHVILPTFMGSTPALRRMVIERDLPHRTALQQLSNIYWHWKDMGSVSMAVDKAFDVESVTKRFFEEYKRVFESVMASVKQGFGPSKEEEDAKKLFVQTLFNRLMFIYFLSRKGWLKFKGDPDYLAALWKDYQKNKDKDSFYTERLRNLFFVGLNNPRAANLMKDNPALYALIGDITFLNGGLFNREELDEISGIEVPDEAFNAIFNDLFQRYNFTVTESTPLDQEVAVDPEMLGKVFEELVTGRHETGSYYTPRPVVSFMCREALKGYLQEAVVTLPTEAIQRFVDQHDVSGLNLTSAEKVRKALEQIKVVDPACGSGAYLLGMMHELVELETALYSEKLLMDTKSLYDLKLRIIEENVYGADIDQFAVNIAMLRLWLSLAIEYESFPPPPLPNLDFKIVCGDSLTAPDPNPSEQNPQYEMFRNQAHKASARLIELKHQHMISAGTDKRQLVDEIEGEMANLRAALEFSPAPDDAVDWRVTFSEVFEQNGGFDVVIANPPYVRQENIGPNKPKLRQLFAEAVTGMSDFYCYFYARGVQLLRVGGMHVFVCSNSWLDVGYGAKLQEFLLKTTWIRAVYDSAVERQFSTAAINTVISIIQKTQTRRDEATHFVSLKGPFDAALADQSLRREIVVNKKELYEGGIEQEPESKSGANYIGDKWGGKYLRAPDIYWTILEKGKGKLVRLGDIAEVRRGFTTGANEFFYLDDERIREWEIEEEFFKPVIKSPKECKRILIDEKELKFKIFICHEARRELQHTAALEYIKWGESQGFHERPTCATRQKWYELKSGNWPALVWVKSINDRHLQARIPFEALVDQRLYEMSHNTPDRLNMVLNSAVTILFKELAGRVNLGEGALDTAVYEANNINVLEPDLLYNQPIESIESTLASRDILPVDEELQTQEHKAIDNIIFDILCLTKAERDAVYEAVISLVEGRLKKAGSVKRRQYYEHTSYQY